MSHHQTSARYHRQHLQRTHQEERGDKEQKTTILHGGCRVLPTHQHGPHNYTTRLLMANSRVQQESKMQEQHYGVNTHPVMTTIEQFIYRLQRQVTLWEGQLIIFVMSACILCCKHVMSCLH
jgi:hypothetical protein